VTVLYIYGMESQVLEIKNGCNAKALSKQMLNKYYANATVTSTVGARLEKDAVSNIQESS